MTSSQGDAPAAMLYQHCESAYNKMLETAKRVDGAVVWEGALTRLITHDLNLSIPYYTSITRTLRAMGCIRQLKRGGGTAGSQWELINDPSEEKFSAVMAQGAPTPDTKGPMGTGLMSQHSYQINQILRRLQTLEDALVNIIEEEGVVQDGE